MPDKPTRITATVDIDAPGRQTGFLRLPHSVHRSAYGWLPIPIVTVARGDGPTVLLIAGNHGDEYEGQVALMKLARSLRPEQVQGRVILLPAANFPAVMAGLRTSPIDGGNLNRSFPGDADGGPTPMIAHYIATELAPRARYVLDLHAGGSSLLYLPSLLTRRPDEPERRAEVRRLVEALAIPHSLMLQAADSRMLAGAVEPRGISMTVELGGAGMLTPASVALTEAAVARYLAATGVWAGPPPKAAPAAPRLMTLRPDHYVYAPDSGVFEPLVDLGDTVAAGQPAALVHFPDTPWREPVPVAFDAPGLVLCKRVPSLCQRGDCLFHLAADDPGALR